MSTTTSAQPLSDPTPIASDGPVGRVVSVSMATGAVGAGTAVFGILPGAPEAAVTGGALIGFAAGWAVLAWATARFTARPQRWAYVPATVMAAAGTALLALAPGEPVLTFLAWVWAPALVVLAVWMERAIRRSIRGRRAVPVYAVALAMLLGGLGGLYQAGADDPTVAAGPMPGKLVDVGGYRLHISCTGAGAPTVVLLNGLGETSPQWARVTPAVSAGTRVCAYDRAGQGWSDDAPHPADATSAATDLHKLLTAAGEHGPYVLAGHSSGGIHALTYAHRYPSDVAGMVLLDSASPRQTRLVKPFNGEYQVMRRVLAIAPTLFRFGVGHITAAAGTPDLPGQAGHQAATFANSPRGMRGMRAEQADLPTAFAQAQALTTLGSTPLVVLTAQDNVDRKPGWGTAQDQLAALSTNSRHTVADLDHMAFLNDPAGAALSVTAVADVVTAVRNHTPVPTR